MTASATLFDGSHGDFESDDCYHRQYINLPVEGNVLLRVLAPHSLAIQRDFGATCFSLVSFVPGFTTPCSVEGCLLLPPQRLRTTSLLIHASRLPGSHS